jgi:hypothetical protein
MAITDKGLEVMGFKPPVNIVERPAPVIVAPVVARPISPEPVARIPEPVAEIPEVPEAKKPEESTGEATPQVPMTLGMPKGTNQNNKVLPLTRPVNKQI